MEKIKKYVDLIYKYRFYIALVIFLLCVIFEISGSSIGMWKQFITSDTSEGVLLGKSRGIRSDEWAVYTPMLFSQVKDGFNYFSNVIRGGNTDVFIIYGLPVLNLVQIFRPFLLGFIFLGATKGLSFFWCGRVIALFLVTFELVMMLTNKNKLLSFIGSIMISLSPIIQWWFGVCGTSELFIYGGLLLILLKNYLITSDFWKRCLYLLLIDIFAGGYVLIFYPAWQVPMAYAFLAIAIWIIIDNIKECKISLKDIISIVIALIVFGLSMGYIFSRSIETIKTVMNTVYPGARCELGGSVGKRYFYYIMNIFLPFKESGLLTNTCEESLFFTLFPMGIIISIVNMVKTKKKDILTITLLSAYVFLSFWCIIGYPKIIAKITLLSNSQASRSLMAVGFLDIALLLRSLSIMKEPLKKATSIIIAVLLSICLVVITVIGYKGYFTIKAMSLCMFIMCVYLFYCICRYKAKYVNYLFTIGITFVMFMTGATINPVRIGTKVVYNDNLINEIQKINEAESGNWIVEELGFPNTNYLLMAGASTINSTNVYPDLEKWHKIDKEKKYEDVYNRYAHIKIKLVKNSKEIDEKFKLLTPDSFEVYITPEELETLNIKYIFTVNQLGEYSNKNIEIKQISEINQYKVFRVDYK